MTDFKNKVVTTDNGEMSLKDILNFIISWMLFLKTKWMLILLIAFLGALLGYFNAYRDKPQYTATLTFALDDEKPTAGGGLTGAMGLASSLGFDLGSNAGGAFNGANLIELMKSRTLVEKAFLNPILVNGNNISLAQYYIEFNKLNERWVDNASMKEIKFEASQERSKYGRIKDSILGNLYGQMIAMDGGLSVYQKDKKISIITVDVKSKNELFSKTFAESLAKEVSIFYIETKSRKARTNVSILQKQVDSVRSELNEAISGVAIANDNVFNLNSALNVKKTPTSRRQVDVQANTAILTQLVTNLEMAKVTLMKETPLIQIIDRPILPLERTKKGKLKSIMFGGIWGAFLILLFIISRRVLVNTLKQD